MRQKEGERHRRGRQRVKETETGRLFTSPTVVSVSLEQREVVGNRTREVV